MVKAQAPVVVITGASAGIGRAVVREFAKDHARIGLLARGVEGLEGARREVVDAGGEALVLPTDVADHEAVDRAAAEVEEAFGPIDIWINVAMVSVLSPIKLMKPEEMKRITEVTYLGYVYGTMAALRRMLPRDRGTIVQVGSALAYRSIPLQAGYCAAKHAIVGFTESLRCELIHDGSNVKVTMVHLPGVNTTQFEWIKNRMPNTPKPVGKIYQPEVAARAIHWAAHHPERRQLLVGMPTLQSVIAEKVAPGLMDHYLADIVYTGHQTHTPDDPNRPDNLWQPVPGDHGSHGPFDAQAVDTSMQTRLSEHRGWIVGGVAAMAAAGLAMWWQSRTSGSAPGQPRHVSHAAAEPMAMTWS